MGPFVPGQSNWCWCYKCSGLFFAGNVAPGACPAGGQHDGSQSGDYTLAFTNPLVPVAVWQWCNAQLMRKNPSEAIVDKDNRLRDALKYILLSLPNPSEPPAELEREQMIRDAYNDGSYATIGVRMLEYDAKHRVKAEPVSYRPLLLRS